MKRLLVLFIITIYTLGSVFAQDVTTVEAKSSDISDNLDLEAVASIFGEAKDLEDFEKKLNDPELQISNLDLNEDGEVDYLRVLETSEKDVHVVTIQAVIGKDQFQDVAVISVEKDDKGETTVQVVGDVYMYGPDYIIQPVYVHPPVIWVWFWGPLYSPWRSPWYWGYYPPYYRPWAPFPPHRYRTNVHVHINVNNSYHRTNVRVSNTSVKIQERNRSNDYGRSNPDRSFEKRNDGAKNRAELTERRESGNTPSTRDNREKVNSRESRDKVSTGREVQQDWKPASEREGRESRVKDDKVSVPSNNNKRDGQRPQNQPSTQQSRDRSNSTPTQTQPTQRPANQPAKTQPTQRPANQPAKTQPTQRPAQQPANRTTPQKKPTKRGGGGLN